MRCVYQAISGWNRLAERSHGWLGKEETILVAPGLRDAFDGVQTAEVSGGVLEVQRQALEP